MTRIKAKTIFKITSLCALIVNMTTIFYFHGNISLRNISSTLYYRNHDNVDADHDEEAIMRHFKDIIPLEKEPIVRILIRSKVDGITQELIESLPSINDFHTMYGAAAGSGSSSSSSSEQQTQKQHHYQPKIIGLETCQTFKDNTSPLDAIVGPAGLFNTGTNLLFQLMLKHCYFQQRVDAFDEQLSIKKEQKQKYYFHGSGDSGTTSTSNHKDKDEDRILQSKRSGIFDDVPWGKHSPVQWREETKTTTTTTITTATTFTTTYKPDSLMINQVYPRLKNKNVFPVVMIKDPYTWTGSMCRNQYSTHWLPSPYSCVNMNEEYDRYNSTTYSYRNRSAKTINSRFRKNKTRRSSLSSSTSSLSSSVNGMKFVKPKRQKIRNQNGVKVDYENGRYMRYSNLMDMWNTYYKHYLNANFPHLIVRYEDILLYPNEIVTQICDCVGGTIHNNERGIHLDQHSAKDENIFGKSGNLMESLQRYGNVKLRTEHLSEGDMISTEEYIDKNIMNLFQYSFPQKKEIIQDEGQIFQIQNPRQRKGEIA